MHPETLRLYEAARQRGLKPTAWPMRIMAGPHHFHVTHAVHQAATAIASHEAAAAEVPVFPTSARMPAERMVLTVHGEKTGRPVCLLLYRGADEVVFVTLATDVRFFPSFWFRPGTVECGRSMPEDFQDQVTAGGIAALSDAEAMNGAWRIAFILSLINTPRKVQIAAASGLDWSRQHRKAVERVTGSAAMAFSVVSWELGRRCKAIGNEISTEGHPKALHWCRAHWREAAKGQPKAEWVYVPALGGWGWRTWVTDCWKGHPDYGVKLQRHQPRMPGEKPETPKASGQAVLDKTRWEAMSAAHRAAMVEAGYAPTTAVH